MNYCISTSLVYLIIIMQTKFFLGLTCLPWGPILTKDEFFTLDTFLWSVPILPVHDGLITLELYEEETWIVFRPQKIIYY